MKTISEQRQEIKTYFGLKVYPSQGVKESDIKKLPFYDFWYESAKCSTMLKEDNGEIYVYLHDWERFCVLFIKTGSHRNN